MLSRYSVIQRYYKILKAAVQEYNFLGFKNLHLCSNL